VEIWSLRAVDLVVLSLCFKEGRRLKKIVNFVEGKSAPQRKSWLPLRLCFTACFVFCVYVYGRSMGSRDCRSTLLQTCCKISDIWRLKRIVSSDSTELTGAIRTVAACAFRRGGARCLLAAPLQWVHSFDHLASFSCLPPSSVSFFLYISTSSPGHG